MEGREAGVPACEAAVASTHGVHRRTPRQQQPQHLQVAAPRHNLSWDVGTRHY